MQMSLGEAFAAKKNNKRSEWHVGTSFETSNNPDHAPARIFAGYADLNPIYTGPKLHRSDAIFAMGSCFAREIEAELISRGGNVISVDRERIDRPEFHDAEHRVRDAFFHRFTPYAILHEFLIAFDRLQGWDPEHSLLFPIGKETIDLNYWNVDGSDLSLEATLVRRQIASELVKRAAQAKVIILTLGLTEGWIHAPTGFHINRFVPKVARNREEFVFATQTFEDVQKSLNQVYKLIRRRHQTGDFQFVLTVSPVPLQATFTGKDIVIANMDSKATLRAAAVEFADRYANVHYFPSYEMVHYSNLQLAWRPDRMHVNRGMVSKIVSKFVDTYYQSGELGAARPNVEKPAKASQAPPRGSSTGIKRLFARRS
jgi:hypothetical protein